VASSRQPVGEEGLRGDEQIDAKLVVYPSLEDFRILTVFFNNNDFIPTAELDYCTEMDQPFLEGLLRGNSQLARQA